MLCPYNESMNSQNHKRYLELDLLRVLAILAMLVYHTAFDLWYFFDWNIPIYIGEPLAIPRNFSSVFWWLLGKGTASLFLLLVGISFVISWNRTVCHGEQRHGELVEPRTMTQGWKKFFKRGLFILSCGMLVTLVTYIFDPSTYIRFGILHLIGVSILLLPFFMQLKTTNYQLPFGLELRAERQTTNFILGILCIFIGNFMLQTPVETPLLLPLGFTPHNFTTMDYFPLLPWFGVVLLGTSIGHLLYIQSPSWRSKFLVFQPSPLCLRSGLRPAGNYSLSMINWVSRSSLWIYLLHQPVILGLLSLVLATPW